MEQEQQSDNNNEEKQWYKDILQSPVVNVCGEEKPNPREISPQEIFPLFTNAEAMRKFFS